MSLEELSKRFDSIVNLKDKLKVCQTALELVLLFHSGSPWTFDKQQDWANKLTELLGPAAGRDPKVVNAYGDGTWDGVKPTNEATTKNLCNAVRAALARI